MRDPIRMAKEAYLELLGCLHDVRAQLVLAPLAKGYLPWSDASLRPGAVVALLNDIVANDRQFVLELGAGISTVFLARHLQGSDVRMVSVEHDEAWIGTLTRLLQREGLDGVVELAHVPLASTETPWGHVDFYEQRQLLTAISTEKIDLLVVDGPPAGVKAHPHSRYPALPMLASVLAPNATIVLDDIGRDGEQAVCSSWEKDFNLQFKRHATKGGYAVVQGGRHWTI